MAVLNWLVTWVWIVSNSALPSPDANSDESVSTSTMKLLILL